MKKWVLAEYLLESKKSIDSITFVDDNIDKLSNLDIRKIIEDELQKFYINLRVIYDKCLSKEEKILLRENDEIYNDTLYHRDKKYAHKDDKYKRKDYNSRIELIDDLKEKLLHCYEVCKANLPEVITFDFISYDRNLYRIINNITPEKEKILKEIMYKNDINNFPKEEAKEYKIFNDIEDIYYIEDPKEYAVTIENGINLYEGLQNRQDACIRINVLFKENIWCSLKDKKE